MDYHYRIALTIAIIIFSIILTIKRKRVLWIFLLCLGLLPFIAMLSGAIYSTFNGTGLVGDSGGIESGLFVIIGCFIYQWYIYIPIFVLLIISLYKVFIKR